jgi:hypothetical protein
MKIWIENAGDHSANLKIIGTFKSEDDAQKAVDTINSMIDITQSAGEPKPGDSFAKEVLDFMAKNNTPFSPEAVASCAYYSPVKRVGKAIEVRTDELEIQILIGTFIYCGGKIELYSLHNYA